MRRKQSIFLVFLLFTISVVFGVTGGTGARINSKLIRSAEVESFLVQAGINYDYFYRKFCYEESKIMSISNDEYWTNDYLILTVNGKDHLFNIAFKESPEGYKWAEESLAISLLESEDLTQTLWLSNSFFEKQARAWQKRHEWAITDGIQDAKKGSFFMKIGWSAMSAIPAVASGGATIPMTVAMLSTTNNMLDCIKDLISVRPEDFLWLELGISLLEKEHPVLRTISDQVAMRESLEKKISKLSTAVSDIKELIKSYSKLIKNLKADEISGEELIVEIGNSESIILKNTGVLLEDETLLDIGEKIGIIPLTVNIASLNIDAIKDILLNEIKKMTSSLSKRAVYIITNIEYHALFGKIMAEEIADLIIEKKNILNKKHSGQEDFDRLVEISVAIRMYQKVYWACYTQMYENMIFYSRAKGLKGALDGLMITKKELEELEKQKKSVEEYTNNLKDAESCYFDIYYHFHSAHLTTSKKMGDVVNKPFEFMALVKGTRFYIEDNQLKTPGANAEKSKRIVNLRYDFSMGQYEVTNAQFIDFLNDVGVDSSGKFNGHVILRWKSNHYEEPFIILYDYKQKEYTISDFNKELFPVVRVSWWGAMEYCNWLSRKSGLKIAYDKTGNLLNKNGEITDDITEVEGFRLPTIAEWQYAALGGDKALNDGYPQTGNNNVKYSQKQTVESTNHAKFAIIRDDGTFEVGHYEPNVLDIYDMVGNALEWCTDCWSFDRSFNEDFPKINPVSVKNPEKIKCPHLFLGAHSKIEIDYLSSMATARNTNDDLGFRLAKTGRVHTKELTHIAYEIPLQIQSDPPGASVYINTCFIGKTPVQEELKMGNYHMTIEMNSYKTVEKEIEIGNRQTASFDVKLIKKTKVQADSPHPLKLFVAEWGKYEKKEFFNEKDTGVKYVFKFENWHSEHYIESYWYLPDGTLYKKNPPRTYGKADTDDGFLYRSTGYSFSKAKNLLKTLKNNPGRWKIELFLDGKYLDTLYFTFQNAEEQRTQKNTEQKPESFQIKFNNSYLIYIPAKDTLQLAAEGHVLSYGESWIVKGLKPYLFHLKHKNWNYIWQINTSRREVHKITNGHFGSLGGDKKRISVGVEVTEDEKSQSPLSFIIRFSDTRMIYKPDTQNLRILAAGSDISYSQEWLKKNMKNYLFHLKKKSWRGFFWKINTSRGTVYQVLNGEFGQYGGESKEISLNLDTLF